MAKYLVDTNSLLSVVTYYLPFDDNGILQNEIEHLFNNGICVLLEAVKKEIGWVRKGIVLNKMPFFTAIKPQENINIVDAKTHRRIDNNWSVHKEKAKIEPEEYEQAKQDALEKADFQLLLTALNDKNCTIVTEESRATNDGKVFKKIPLIAEQEKLQCINLPEMLKQCGISVDFTLAAHETPQG